MKLIRAAVMVTLPMLAQTVRAGDMTTDAAIGGAIGGAVGGAVGAQVGGREGAVVGAGIGGAAGAAIATDGDKDPRRDARDYDDRRYEDDRYRQPSKFCPPGQAKKGRC